MTSIPRNPMKFLWWLKRILYLWVRTKVLPFEQNLSELGIDPQKPICYVLYSRSVSDLLVLDSICKKHKLPPPHHRPTALKAAGSASYIYLQKMGLLKVARGSGKQPPSPMLSLVQQAEASKQMDVQLVPVSVYWGRNPGSDERSLFKLLFFDDERAGMIQKFFIVLAQGRNNFIHFGKPISLRQQVDEGLGAEQTAKKLRRVLRVHYRRQRNVTMGPSLPDRQQVVSHLLGAKPIRDAIQDEAQKKKISPAKARARAQSYFLEIAADMKYPVVRLYEVSLRWVWHKIFDGVVVKHIDRMRSLAESHEIVLLPSHRSHMDYLLLAWSVFNEGMVVPHTAAGVNLNFWPAGPLLRRAGGFYIRRSFGGNRLYAACFNEYVHHLLTKGHTLKFYLEGGRSRTGKLLNPKTGMLSMILGSFYRDSKKPIALMPVYLGYDKVPEVATYLSELGGKKKSKESIRQFFNLFRILRMKFGKAYIGFGEPIMLEDYLNEHQPNWKSDAEQSDGHPVWHSQIVRSLADETQRRVNSAAIINPVSMFAVVMLSTPTKAMAEDELIYLMDSFIHALRVIPYSDDVTLQEGTGKEFLEQAMSVCRVGRFAHPGGDVIHLDESESTILTYYRNNILHLICIPALVASFLQHNDEINEDELVSGASLLYPFLKSEYFLRWRLESAERVVRKTIEALVGEGLLVRNGDRIARPSFSSRKFSGTNVLGRSLGQTLERYAISTVLLSQYIDKGYVDRAEFERQCQLMAQRIAILNGTHDPEFIDKGVFRNYIDLLKRLDYVDQDASEQLRVKPSVKEIASRCLSLLSVDIRQSIARITLESSN